MSHEFVIQPNRSLSRMGRNYLFVAMGLIMTLVSIRFVLIGGWMVIPFMLLEMIAFVSAFCLVGQRCCIVERIVIDADSLTIHHEESRRPARWSFPLHWVKVELLPGKHPSYGTRLLIGSHGKWIELADFLTNAERDSLSKAIRQAIVEARQPAWKR